MTKRLLFLSLIAIVSLATEPASLLGADLNGTYRATAYAQTGITKSGEWTHRHIVAADPDILPIGSRIKIRRAGRYSGEYVVADTGSKVQGRHLDIYMPSEKACKRFGTKPVRVRVLSLGSGTLESVKASDQAVKTDVAKDLQKKVVGNAATQDDWNGSKAKVQAEQQVKATTPSNGTSSEQSTTPVTTKEQ